jgi:hypothetical protein
MGFTREEMESYEKQTPAQVDDTKNPFDGATPAQTATAEDIAAAEAAKNAPQTALGSATDDDADPSGDGAGNSEDQSVTGDDGTSDDNADSSTASAGPSGESDSDEGDGSTQVEKPAPKKGSAAARIQELLDLTEGYKEFGALKIQELREAQAEIARLKGGGTVAPVKTVESEVNVENEPMPDLTDPDVNFDTDKLRVKTEKWVKAQVKSGVKTAVSEITGITEAEKLRVDVETKIGIFKAAHADYDDVVTKNAKLNKRENQFGPDASLAIARSPLAADIIYYFGKHTDLAVSTAKQSPAEQLLAVGEVVAKIKADKAAKASKQGNPIPNNQGNEKTVPDAKSGKQKSLTQAPPPPSPTRAGGRAQPRDVQDPTLSMDDFAKRHREEKQLKRESARKARGLE